MTSRHRHTIVAHGSFAMRELRLAAARERRQGFQVMTFEQLAARLAGGFARPIDDELLRTTIRSVLPPTELGELESIKSLPGMVDAAADTLRKAWRAGIDLRARAAEHPRLASIAALEEAVLSALPPSVMCPTDLVAAAFKRLLHVEPLFGDIEIIGITELSPCWRPLLHAIAAQTDVRWIAGPRPIPPWLDSRALEIVKAEPDRPEILTVSAATAYHETIEAIRWARQLIVSGQAKPEEIAIASVNPADYDEHVLALRADANLAIHFVHGIKITACREGQAAAALADVLLRGLSQSRLRRLSALLAPYPGPFRDLPEGWTHILPSDAPLNSAEAWFRLIDRLTPASWPDDIDHNATLRGIISVLKQGINAAEATGEALLSGRTRTIWRRALLAGPVASLDLTLENLKQDDGQEACVSIAWMPANALASSARPFVRLLGLNSSRWPRPISEDRLLSDHIISTNELDPLPVSAADRRDFSTILATTSRQIVLSRARRDSEGRLLGRSVLLAAYPTEIYLRRNRIPHHAFSETDRLMARPVEFQTLPQAVAANVCWRNWGRDEITPHDGLVRADHPAIIAVLGRSHSASSLRHLLRNPLGFVWNYGLYWQAPNSGEDPLVLDAAAMGNLVHLTLDLALRRVEANGGLVGATQQNITAAVETAAVEVAAIWEAEQAVPPRIIWQRTIADVREMSVTALIQSNTQFLGATSFSEVPFGGTDPKSEGAVPWDASAIVEIPNTGFRIKGYIDRLDLSSDGREASVRDYKTGRKPKDDIILDGGKELQRCLYGFAVKAMLREDVQISASLVYLKEKAELPLTDPDTTLTAISGYLCSARANLLAGGVLIGPDAGDTYDALAFALPANAKATYCKRKSVAANDRLGDATLIWEAQ